MTMTITYSTKRVLLHSQPLSFCFNMEQIKRQHSNVDDNKKKKLTGSLNSLSTNFITCFEDLSNEIIYEIFDFLDFFQVHEFFSDLNRRFKSLVIHSTLPIKIKLLSASKSNFQRYHTQIIMPNQHRIKSLHLSNPFLIDRVFSSICNGLKLTQLETLILDKIQSTSLEYLLKHLLVLPYLSSLIIDCEDNVENRNNLYYEIFRLPRLKYCKLSLNELNQSEPLPMATNKCSPIEHLILIGTYFLYDFNNLLSYTPHLKHLSIHSSNHFPIEKMQQHSSVLTHLTHVSLNSRDIPFDLFESMVQSLFNQIQVLHISVYYNIEYLNADRWQRLIQSHMPQLRIFDIDVEFVFYYPQTIFYFIPQINKFNSPFWSKRQWFFEHQTYENRYRTFVNFFSTNPYRRKQYKLYGKKSKDIDISSEKPIMNSVHQLGIQNGKAICCCRNYFPNITELIICYCSSEESKNLHSTSLNSIIPLNQLTKLILRSYRDDFSTIIKLLQYTPNIHTFEIENVEFKNSDLVSTEKSEAFRLVSQTNNIRNMIIHHCQQTWNISKFLVNLCPRLYQLSIACGYNLQSFLQFLLSNDAERLNYLFLLRITCVSDNDMKTLKNFINREKLLDQYSLQIQYNKFNNIMYLWW